MPGWESLEAVTRLHGGAQIAGLILLALTAALAAVVAWQLHKGSWGEWLDFGEYQIRSRFLTMGCAAVLGLLAATELFAYGYGVRHETLQAEADRVNAERIRKLNADLQAQARRPVDPLPNRVIKENSDLRQKLIEAENRIAALDRLQSQKRLSEDQRRLLIEALRGFAGQKISVASIQGDDESLILAQDFVSVFDAAGWDRGGASGVSGQQWARDPVGVEVMLNEFDARGGRIAAGLGALINTVRKLGLVYDNTIYMSDEVPPGEAQLRVGRKLKR
jgi:hypothetical protein